MFSHSHPNYVCVTKIPRMLILYFTFLKNNDNSSSNDTVLIESALYVFFVLFECFLLFLANSASYLPRTSRCPYLYRSPYSYPLLYQIWLWNFFLKKNPYRLNESQKTSFGGTFSPYQWFYWTYCFQENKVDPCVDSHQPCEFHKNRFKTATSILTVIIIINWKFSGVIF